jgi:ABC-type antimicrobial peptide transport system permease subunit
MVFSVSSMQEDVVLSADRRDSGTGGFRLMAESSYAIPDDLNTVKGRRRILVNPDRWPQGVELVSVNVHEGDDASCFNLNRAQMPRLLGVPTEVFSSLGAFVSSKGEDPWQLLQARQPEGIIPGLAADMNTAMWGLKKKTGVKDGDLLTYRDERGNFFKVRLVGTLPMSVSVLQGTVLISREAFNTRFPSSGGYRQLLVDVKPGLAPALLDDLRERLVQAGFDVTPTVQRLKDLHAVEASYLAMFVLLGGLGLVLGSAGLGVMVLRNVFERRAEIGILRCMGYSRPAIMRMILAEHWLLLGGLVVGVVAAAVAVWPSLRTPEVHLPFIAMAGILGGMVIGGVLWTAIAARLALRGDPLAGLRNE